MTGTVVLKESIQDSDPASTDVHTLDDRIRRRAHEIWLQPGIQNGSAAAVWLQAEEEIRNQQKSPVRT
jgi:hypothetical protein